MSFNLYKDFLPDTDSTLDIGKTATRWLNVWGDTITGGTITDGTATLTGNTLTAGTITDGTASLIGGNLTVIGTIGASGDADLVTLASDVVTIAGKVVSTVGRVIATTRATTTYTILVTDHAVFCDTDGGAFTATLPAGVDGQEFKISNTGTSSNNLTVAPNGSELLIGVNSNFILADGESLNLVFESTEGWS